MQTVGVNARVGGGSITSAPKESEVACARMRPWALGVTQTVNPTLRLLAQRIARAREETPSRLHTSRPSTVWRTPGPYATLAELPLYGTGHGDTVILKGCVQQQPSALTGSELDIVL